MARTSFLGDLVSNLYGLSRWPLGGDRRSIEDLCRALLSSAGEVAGLRLAASIFGRYQQMTTEEKFAFFTFLNEELDVDAAKVAGLAQAYSEDPSTENFSALVRAAEPRRQELFRRLHEVPEATAALVAARLDLLDMLRDHPELKRTDMDLVHLLRSWFNRGFLTIQQIDWNTSATLLEKVVAYEAVHEIHDWDDLRRRLHPADRRCFAFFHPAMPDEPLIFVEVALTKGVPGSIQGLLADEREALAAEEANTAVFYSISNCQKGLKGISFGNFLIKQVVTELSQELPGLNTFVTLSPMPGLNRWLKTLDGDAKAARLLAGEASEAEAEALAARYLLEARRPDGFPRDPVARFHLGNGAIIHDVHAGADISENGMNQSSGMMVNYLYDRGQTEKNHEAFTGEKKIAASRGVRGKVRSDRGGTPATPPVPETAD
ncbi:malonyl-CoA decarboxylase family protein [Tropicimonas sp. TH_r6]|uniref:malonyl-CoA decarboxylase domain-containing protein n=1 Tax=Tropicimonas sp. TH_r6 TaxID=3082085 RepID=UPI0029536A4B|nr:malonyl-CoA decarboxylase family protein [Tropicimonas sp. TH_r6]MDV7143304.1 malonyl-CoA decarboxylase family protein [Tropicimonas sp. TH_r6]